VLLNQETKPKLHFGKWPDRAITPHESHSLVFNVFAAKSLIQNMLYQRTQIGTRNTKEAKKPRKPKEARNLAYEFFFDADHRLA
jgi:hypothetical protein